VFYISSVSQLLHRCGQQGALEETVVKPRYRANQKQKCLRMAQNTPVLQGEISRSSNSVSNAEILTMCPHCPSLGIVRVVFQSCCEKSRAEYPTILSGQPE
jgi:hypothetical protein